MCVCVENKQALSSCSDYYTVGSSDSTCKSRDTSGTWKVVMPETSPLRVEEKDLTVKKQVCQKEPDHLVHQILTIPTTINPEKRPAVGF